MKPLLTLFAVACIASSAFGKQISESDARFNAYKYAPSGKIQPAKRLHGASGGNAPYYAFNLDRGYVIVSGDDELTELVGYSTSGCFDSDNVPPQLEAWLDAYAQYVASVQRGKTKATVKRTLADQPSVIVEPLLSTKWNQSEPYNLLAPTFQTAYGNIGHCPTGCAATAMAQVMKYYNWPETGVGSNSYEHPTFGTISSDFSSHTYDWANMADTYDGDYSSTQANAVALLMKDCGVALNMYYAADASSAQLYSFYTGFTNYFRYTAKIVNHTDMSTAEFAKCITDELDASRPVLYTGIGDGGGHAFVADGYDSNGFLHINWGWGGYSDGYFDMNYMNPGGLGIGGGSGAFKWNQAVVLAKPLRDGETAYEQHTLGFVDTNSSTGGLAFKGDGPLIAGEDASIWLTNIYNSSPTTFVGSIAVAAFDESGAMVKLGDAANITNGFGSRSYYPTEFEFPLPTDGLTDGSYTVYAVSKYAGNTEWEKFASNRFLTLTVADGEATFTKPVPKLTVSNVSRESSTVDKGATMQAVITLHNSSAAVADGNISYKILRVATGETMATGTDHAIVYDNSDYSFSVSASTSDYAIGDYLILIDGLTATDGTVLPVEQNDILFTVVNTTTVHRQLIFYDPGTHDQGLSVSPETFSADAPATLYYRYLANPHAESWTGHIGLKVENLSTGAADYNDFGVLSDIPSNNYYEALSVGTNYTILGSLADGIYRVSGVVKEVVGSFTFPDWIPIGNESHFDLRSSGGTYSVIHPADEIAINKFAIADPILIGKDNIFSFTLESKSDKQMNAKLILTFFKDGLCIDVAEKTVTLSPYELRNESLYHMLNETVYSGGATYSVVPYVQYGGTVHEGTPVTFIGKTSGVESMSADAISLWPNPTANVIHVSTEARRIDIYNATGAHVAQSADTSEMSVAHLPAGYYVAVVTTDGGTVKVPFVKK